MAQRRTLMLDDKKRFEVQPFDLGVAKIDLTCTGAALSALVDLDGMDEKRQK